MEIIIYCVEVKKSAYATIRGLSVSTGGCHFAAGRSDFFLAFESLQGEVSYLQDKKRGIEMISGDLTNKDSGERHGRNNVELEAVDFCSGRRT